MSMLGLGITTVEINIHLHAALGSNVCHVLTLCRCGSKDILANELCGLLGDISIAYRSVRFIIAHFWPSRKERPR